jgi:hypothetical protein
MQTLTVVFDEILHVHRNRATQSHPRHTVFSFMSENKYTPYVTVPGWPRLEPGMKVKALLRETDKWSTLIGWVDLDTGQITDIHPNQRVLGLLLMTCGLAFISSFLWRSALTPQPSKTILLLLLAGFWLLSSRVEYKAWRQGQLALKALQSLVRADDA